MSSLGYTTSDSDRFCRRVFCNLSGVGWLSLVARVTDEALMRAVRDGDVGQLGVLFERHHAALFDFLARMTGNRTAAEDLTQDVFVRMLKYRGTFRDEGRFETWMFRIARNARADYFRRHSAVELRRDTLEAAADVPERAHVEQDEQVVLLKRALLQLADDRRELIVLARYRGLSHKAIAEMLGIEPGAVKVRIHRALKELRDIALTLEKDQSWNVKTPS